MTHGALMGRVLCGLAAWLVAPALQAQPASAERRVPGQAPVLEQQRAGIAYRELQQAQYEAKLAEQDVLNTQDAYKTTSARAEALKAELEKLIKVRDAAKAKEAVARKRYDAALDAVPR